MRWEIFYGNISLEDFVNKKLPRFHFKKEVNQLREYNTEFNKRATFPVINNNPIKVEMESCVVFIVHSCYPDLDSTFGLKSKCYCIGLTLKKISEIKQC